MSHAWTNEELKSFKLLLRKISQDFKKEEDVKEAKVIAKLLTETTPADAEAWFYLGCLNCILGLNDEAYNNHLQSVDRGGKNHANFIQLANICTRKGHIKEALQWCLKARKCSPGNPETYHVLADLYLLQDNTTEAIDALESLLKRSDLQRNHRADTLARIGKLCIQIQHLKKALAYLKEARKLNPEDVSLLADMGHCLSQTGNIDEALEVFKKAASAHASPLNLYNLGDAYLAMDDPERAIAPLIEATRKEASYLLAHYDLSLAFVALGKYQEGVKASMAVLRSDPEMKMQQTNLGLGAMGNLGLCLMNLERYEDALGCFKRNENLFGPTFFNIGLTLFRMKRYKQALEYFQKAINNSPDDAEYLNLAGQTYAALGNVKTGKKYLLASIKKDPHNALNCYDLGVILAKAKTRQKEALRWFMQAMQLDPEMSWAYYSVACIYALAGDKKKAFDYLEQSFKKGLQDKKHINADRDLNSLRKCAEFKSMMKKYFGKAGARIQ